MKGNSRGISFRFQRRRVEPAVARWLPLGPGRAFFQHPAPPGSTLSVVHHCSHGFYFECGSSLLALLLGSLLLGSLLLGSLLLAVHYCSRFIIARVVHYCSRGSLLLA
jgi:hypothetical protein